MHSNHYLTGNDQIPVTSLETRESKESLFPKFTTLHHCHFKQLQPYEKVHKKNIWGRWDGSMSACLVEAKKKKKNQSKFTAQPDMCSKAEAA